MREYREVVEYKEATDSAKSICSLQTEMTESQLGFLCGLIRDKRPQKIVEVGVASGGTTLVILQCLKMLEMKSSLFSVDLNERLYSNKEKETGYVARDVEADGRYASIYHRYLLGKYLPEVLLEIDNDIDFLILDTVHHLPGEILDFLAALPLMKNGATVVLHDVTLQHEKETDDYCFATQILFSCVSAEKYINNVDGYPNIAAFCVESDTCENVNDVFSALTLTWNYMLSQEETNIYRAWYNKFFNEQSCRLFEQALEMNSKTLARIDPCFCDYMQTLCDSVLTRYESVYLYGAGKRGKLFNKALDEFWRKRTGKCQFLVSNIEDNRQDCVTWDSVKYEKEKLIILTVDSSEIKKKLRQSETHWLDVPSQIWRDLERKYGSEG